MSFDPVKFSTLGGQLKGGSAYQTFGYLGDTDNKAVVSFAGYFNSIKESLRVNDVIKVLDTTEDTTFVYWLRVSRIALAAPVEVEEISTFYSPVETYSKGHVCLDNTTNTPLAAGGIFNGAYQDTLDFSEIIISVSTDQDSATDGLVIQWSSDGINVNETDEFSILANNGKTFSFPCNRRYVKLQYTNGGTIQGVFDLATYFKRYASKGSSHRINDIIVGQDDAILTKSVLTAKDNTGIFQNLGCTEGGSLKTNIVDNYGFNVENTPMGEIRVAQIVKLVGANFTGNTIDPNFWTTAITGTGTVTQGNSQVLLQTGTIANSTTSIQSIRKGRYVGGTTLRYRAVIQLTDGETGTVNNIRRWGAFDASDGAFFELNGTTMRVVTRKATTDTPVASASWNGKPFTVDLKAHTYEIYWTNSKVWFVVGDDIIHTVNADTTTWSATNILNVRAENYNTNGLATNVQMGIRVQTIARMGQLETSPTYKYLSGAATTVLKYSAGDLHSIVNNDNAGSVIVYDSVSAAGTIIASIDLTKVLGSLTFNAPFSTGLTVVTTGAVKLTFVYE